MFKHVPGMTYAPPEPRMAEGIMVYPGNAPLAWTAVRDDGQVGHIRDILNGVAMFVPWNTGLAELHLVKDLHVRNLNDG